MNEKFNKLQDLAMAAAGVLYYIIGLFYLIAQSASDYSLAFF